MRSLFPYSWRRVQETISQGPIADIVYWTDEYAALCLHGSVHNATLLAPERLDYAAMVIRGWAASLSGLTSAVFITPEYVSSPTIWGLSWNAYMESLRIKPDRRPRNEIGLM